MDQELRSAPVTHLKCSSCGHEMNVEGRAPFSTVPCTACGTMLTVPVMLGGFLLLERMGSGGMGAVYRALDTALNRFVAIKVMKPALGEDAKLVESFIREAQAAAALNHPNIVQIYSCGQEQGQPYIVMELVSGGRMDKMFDRDRPMKEVDLLKIALDVAEGLKAADAAGLVHGDIKPENVLIDAAGTAKIVDFGLAQFVNAQKSRGEIWGTPYYISPERARGKPADHRSDIYSLGATLFHALTGQPPFDGNTPVDVVLARLKQPPPDLATVRPDLQVETVELINRMMEADPVRRFPTSASLLGNTRRALEAAKVAEQQARHAKPPKRNTSSMVIAGIAALAAGALGAWLFTRASEEQAPAPVVRPAPDSRKPAEPPPPEPPRPLRMASVSLGGPSGGIAVQVPLALAQRLGGRSNPVEEANYKDRFPSLIENARLFVQFAGARDRGNFEQMNTLLHQLQRLEAPEASGFPALQPYLEAWRRALLTLEDGQRAVRELVTAGQPDEARRALATYRAALPEALVSGLAGAEDEINALEQAQAAARRAEEQRARREIVQRDLDRIDAKLAELHPLFMRQRDFRRTVILLDGFDSAMETEEGREALALAKEKMERLDGLKQYIMRYANGLPFTRALGSDLNGDVVGATSLGLRLTLDGRAVFTIGWDEISPPSLVRMGDFYASSGRPPVSERARALVALSLYSLFNGAFEPAQAFAERAVALQPAIAQDAQRLMPGLLP
jgi:serine/threonine protein kinase